MIVTELTNVRPFPLDVALGLTIGDEAFINFARERMTTLAASWPDLADRYARQLTWDALVFIAGGGATDPVRLAGDVREICQAAGWSR